jgi:conjugal transfer pilus assembly protein TraU
MIFKAIKIGFATCIIVLIAYSENASAEAFSCHGKIPNPITDVAWISVFPIKIGSATVADMGQEDTGPAPPPICGCPTPSPPWYRVGIGITYWEPARAVDVSTTPMCSPLLGGAKLGDYEKAKKGSARTVSDNRNSFYHLHWFKYPLTAWMAFLMDSTCKTSDGFDVMMMTEFDPSWSDDELSTIFSPDAVLFANPISQAACAVDCIAATLDFPTNTLFWCAGCQGSLYPITGNVINHESGIQASLLLVQRLHSKLHRTFLSFDMNSVTSMCIAMPQPLINKQSYKTQMLYPIPNIEGAKPYGRSEAIWAAGRELPTIGEDFSYIIWRRRVCCAS